jgi:hypothetical protein
MPYSLYMDSDSVCCIFHPLCPGHSCLCCRDVVAIELLWLTDSLIVQMGGLVVKSIQCSDQSVFYLTQGSVEHCCNCKIKLAEHQSVRGL